MPFWQENRPFFLRVGAGAAIVIVGFAISMGLYGDASGEAEGNDDLSERIEEQIEILQRDEANELGWQEALKRKWFELEDQIVHVNRAEFDFPEDGKKLKFKSETDRRGREWREKFEKRNMNVDDSVRKMGFPDITPGTDEDIARLDLVDRIFGAVDRTNLKGIAGVMHHKAQVLAMPHEESENAILRYGVQVEVEGPYTEVSRFLRLLQEPGRYVHLRECTVKPVGEGSVEASANLAAILLLSKESIAEIGVEETSTTGRPAGRGRGFRPGGGGRR